MNTLVYLSNASKYASNKTALIISHTSKKSNIYAKKYTIKLYLYNKYTIFESEKNNNKYIKLDNNYYKLSKHVYIEYVNRNCVDIRGNGEISIEGVNKITKTIKYLDKNVTTWDDWPPEDKQEFLIFDNYKLEKISKSFGKVSNITYLSIFNNEFTQSCNLKFMGKLKKLKELHIHENKNLPEIPLSIAKLKKLRELSIDITNFNKLPISLQNKANIKKMYKIHREYYITYKKYKYRIQGNL
jgi:hypothetical protein